MRKRPAISRVAIQNYKSIRSCEIDLEPITFLVGPNGAGKSNFLEAIRFLSFALESSLERAVEIRYGFAAILRKQSAKPGTIAIDTKFNLASGVQGQYRLKIVESGDKSFSVESEHCTVGVPGDEHFFRVENGLVTGDQGVLPAASEQKLYLVNASGLAAFEPVYRALSSMVIYNPVPDEIRQPQKLLSNRRLVRTGKNLAEIVLRMQRSEPESWVRVTEYMTRIVPGLKGIEAREIGSLGALYFKCEGPRNTLNELSADGMSDGTLRALAILVALFQPEDRYSLTLVGLEEPEAGLHPAATSLLFGQPSRGKQPCARLFVTSHSP